MLVFGLQSDGFADDVDSRLRYRLPDGLVPLEDAGGIPQVFLMRSPDSGLLHMRLAAVWPDLVPGERRVPINGARFRLLMKTPVATQNGGWREASLGGQAIVDQSVALDPFELSIAHRLGQQGGDIVDVEVELSVAGITRTFPWTVRGDSAAIRDRLTALMTDTPATWDAVENAFLGLTADDFIWYPQAPGILPPPTDDSLLAIANHAAPMLLERVAGGWKVADGGPTNFDINLNVPRMQKKTFGLQWSFSDFLAQQNDPGRHLIELNVPAPFEAAELVVVNDLPLAPSGIKSITIDIMTGGPSGRVHHEFKPGEPSAARLRFVRETFEELELRWQARAVVVTSRGPTIVESSWHRSGMMIELNMKNMLLQPLLLGAQPEVFDYVSRISVTVGRRTVELTSADRGTWVVGRQAPESAMVEVILPAGEKVSLGSLPLSQQGLTIGLPDLGVGETIDVIIEAPPDLDARAAYLAVQVENGPWRTLEQGTVLVWPIRRETTLVPPRLRYRTRHVPRGADGETQPINESDWREGVGARLKVEF